jgi:hypothetical protein
MKKKLFSLIMAVAMVASLALQASASNELRVNSSGGIGVNNGVYGANTEMPGDTRIAVVKVTMPPERVTANKLILNPYQLKLTDSTTSGGGFLGSGDDFLATNGGADAPSVITVPMEIKSESDVPLKVGVTATATPGNQNVKIASDAALTGMETDRSVFLYMEMFKNGATAPQVDWTAQNAPEWKSDPEKVDPTIYPQVIAATGSGNKNDAIMAIPAPTGTAVATYVYYKVMGVANSSSSADWTSNDTVNVKLAFTFTPTKLHAISLKKMDNSGNYVNALGTDYSVEGADTTAAPGTVVIVKGATSVGAGGVSTTKMIAGLEVVSTADETVTTTATALDTEMTTWYFTMPNYPVTLRAIIA